jgi:hypothetical protein
MDEEGSAVFVFPSLKDVYELGFDFGKILGNSLAHFLFS